MYFLSRNNKVYSAIVHTRSRYRYLATLVCGTLLVALWFYGIYSPSVDMTKSYVTEYDRLQIQAQRIRYIDKVNDEAQAAYTCASNALAAYSSRDGYQKIIQEILLYIVETAHLHALTLKSSSLDNTADNGWYSSRFLRVMCEGEGVRCVQFLTRLAQLPKITMTHIVLRRVNKSSFELTVILGIMLLK